MAKVQISVCNFAQNETTQPAKDHNSFECQDGLSGSDVIQPQARAPVEAATAEPNPRRKDRPTLAAVTVEPNPGREDRPRPTPTAAVQDPYLPRFINAPTPGKLLLGGDSGMERDLGWYKKLLKQAKCRKKETDDERGRLLCQGLLRAEFSTEELACGNMTGRSRSELNKFIEIPRLNERVLNAIFTQARYQFPGFVDCYTDLQCPTVKALNRICKVTRFNHQNGVARNIERDELRVQQTPTDSHPQNVPNLSSQYNIQTPQTASMATERPCWPTFTGQVSHCYTSGIEMHAGPALDTQPGPPGVEPARL